MILLSISPFVSIFPQPSPLSPLLALICPSRTPLGGLLFRKPSSCPDSPPLPQSLLSIQAPVWLPALLSVVRRLPDFYLEHSLLCVQEAQTRSENKVMSRFNK
ncbi:uncharacterized protein LOC120251804 [Dioscorea cayenensis subsp. rotundata]|uniref:Uncharacterized protein LOC120251804 n=1 Tax=Dioscorea cayennensis subsp. rotundata TaxID=55577 RepID=A0AB40ANA2_DIOCR|nr:uncharacterized protein LOC120251804 [Dioscorea cayenensis subsp. rotundata]